jgi:menaquinone-dependent protoporphyrinogen oxidase
MHLGSRNGRRHTKMGSAALRHRRGTAGGEALMKVLACAATMYGATGEIAQAVADGLAAKGLEVSVVPPGQAGAIEKLDAVVLGSAVCMGQWMKPARELAERQAAALATRPVWLFSSGPGEPPKPVGNPVDVTKIVQATKAATTRLSQARWQKAPQLRSRSVILPRHPGRAHRRRYARPLPLF